MDEVTGPVRSGDGSGVGDLAATLEEAVTAAARPDDRLERFAINQAVFLRYRGRGAGIGPHVDGKCYVLLVAIVTLEGAAAFSVLSPDRSRPPQVVRVGAGDLCLLRAPGFGGRADGRPRHAVGPPLDGDDRVALTLRMRARMGLSGG